MGSLDNLINFKDMSPEEHRRLSSKGGKACQANKKMRKTLKEELLLLLESDKNQENMTLALMRKALDGDIKAFEVIRDSIGEKQSEKIDAKVDSDISIDINLTE